MDSNIINNALIFSGIILLFSLMIRLLYALIFLSKDSRDFFDVFSFRAVLTEASILFLLLFGAYLIALQTDGNNRASIIVAAILLVAIFPTYSYILEPVIKYIKSKKHAHANHGHGIFDKASQFRKYNLKVIIIESNLINAFATGVLPYTKTILLSSKLLDELSKEEAEAILFHEIAHLKHNHLAKLYLINVFILAIGVILHFNTQTFWIETVGIAKPLYLALHAGIFYSLIPMLLSSVVQKRFELQADLFSAKETSNSSLISALTKMNTLTNGQLEKPALTHPVLTHRIKNIETHNR